MEEDWIGGSLGIGIELEITDNLKKNKIERSIVILKIILMLKTILKLKIMLILYS